MSIRPWRDITRKKTKKIKVGSVDIGGDAPISVQSMTNTLTTDIKATVNQIKSLENVGADLVRVSCPDEESSLALKKSSKKLIFRLSLTFIFITKEQLRLQNQALLVCVLIQEI